MDKALATDPKPGETSVQTASAMITGTGAKDLVQLTLAQKQGGHTRAVELTATDGHPFRVPVLEAWVPAKELQPGMHVRTPTGAWAAVTDVRLRVGVGRRVLRTPVGTVRPRRGRSPPSVPQSAPGRSAGRRPAEGLVARGLVRDGVPALPAWPAVAAAMGRCDTRGIDIARILLDVRAHARPGWCRPRPMPLSRPRPPAPAPVAVGLLPSGLTARVPAALAKAAVPERVPQAEAEAGPPALPRSLSTRSCG